MSILCALFGHKSREGEWSGSEYMWLDRYAIDGIGREHAHLRANCPRCGKDYVAGRVHLIPMERDLRTIELLNQQLKEKDDTTRI